LKFPTVVTMETNALRELAKLLTQNCQELSRARCGPNFQEKQIRKIFGPISPKEIALETEPFV
jgi:hypothetical protein